MSLRVVGLASCMLFACGGRATPAEDPIAIGVRLASDSRDWQAHRDLARVQLAQGAAGAALREFLLVERLDELSPSDRSELAQLLLARARKRIALGDPAALEDLEHASSLGVEGPGELEPALALAAVAALRHSSSFSQEKAAAYLAQLRQLDDSDPRLRYQTLASLSPDALLVVLHWFAEAGAKRQALRVAKVYAAQGGRQPAALALWLDLHQWWYGRRRPPLPSEAAALVKEQPTRIARFRGQLADERDLETRGSSAELIQSWQLSSWSAGLTVVEEAFRVDPARSDRKARHFADRDVYGARQRAALAELYYRLGDSKRSKTWALELAALSPGMPSFLLSAGLACAVDGDVGRAEQFLTSAAAASGDPGRYWAIAARSLRLAGHPLAAVGAGRRALSLTAPGRDLMILLEVSRAQRALGRESDAQRSLQTLLLRLPASERSGAQMLVEAAGTGEPSDDGRRPGFFQSFRSELGL